MALVIRYWTKGKCVGKAQLAKTGFVIRFITKIFKITKTLVAIFEMNPFKTNFTKDGWLVVSNSFTALYKKVICDFPGHRLIGITQHRKIKDQMHWNKTNIQCWTNRATKWLKWIFSWPLHFSWCNVERFTVTPCIG